MVSPFVDETTTEATTSSKIQNDEVSSTKGLTSEDESSLKGLDSGDESLHTSLLLSSDDEFRKEEATTSQSVENKPSIESSESEAEKEAILEKYETGPDETLKVSSCDETTEMDTRVIAVNESIEISDEDSINDDVTDNEAELENHGSTEVASNSSLTSADLKASVESNKSKDRNRGSIIYTLISVHVETFRVARKKTPFSSQSSLLT